MAEPVITFTIARSLIAQAAAEGRTIKVTVQGKSRILARLGDAPERTAQEKELDATIAAWNADPNRPGATK